MIKVYIAGPLTTGNIGENIEAAIDTADILWGHGFVPFVPHLMTFYNLQCYHTYEEWMGYDFAWLDSCDCLYRIPGTSSGADREVDYAQQNNKPCFFDVGQMLQYYGSDAAILR